jgi:hypothetical protein
VVEVAVKGDDVALGLQQAAGDGCAPGQDLMLGCPA